MDVLAMLIIGSTLAADDVGKCPISGKPAKEDVFLEVNGKKVHFCCENCVKPYEKKIGLADEGPKACPVSKKEAKADTRLILQKAEVVRFCCEGCVGKYLAKEKLKASDKGAKACAACAKEAKAEFALNVNGEATYFCCDHCRKGYLKKLGAGGASERGNGKCPVSGEDADPEVSLVRVKSEAHYFCCNDCRKGFLAKALAEAAKKAREAEEAEKAGKAKAAGKKAEA